MSPGFKIVPFNEASPGLWDEWVAGIKNSTYLHSRHILSFFHALVTRDKAFTFACVRGDGTPLAIFPLGISKNSGLGPEFYEASWNGAALGIPVFNDMPAHLGAKVRRDAFEYYHGLIKEKGGRRCYLRLHPVSLRKLADQDNAGAQFQLLQEGYECHAQNTLIIDLNNSEEGLISNLSAAQWKHIKRSLKFGLRVAEYGQAAENLRANFLLYQKAHIKSAGRMTRPQETFDLMLKFIEQGKARLFVAYAGQAPVSFLYSVEFFNFASGWSQVNVDEFEKEYSPRHLLEWEAVLSYKRRAFRYYEVGTLFFGPQLYKVPDSKELSISEFKRRYGGVWLADLSFERIFDKELWVYLHQRRLKDFTESSYFDTEREEGITHE